MESSRFSRVQFTANLCIHHAHAFVARGRRKCSLIYNRHLLRRAFPSPLEDKSTGLAGTRSSFPAGLFQFPSFFSLSPFFLFTTLHSKLLKFNNSPRKRTWQFLSFHNVSHLLLVGWECPSWWKFRFMFHLCRCIWEVVKCLRQI